MRLNGFQCDGCGTISTGRDGDQRDPGPFLPAEWWGDANGRGPTFCDDCAQQIKNGALKR